MAAGHCVESVQRLQVRSMIPILQKERLSGRGLQCPALPKQLQKKVHSVGMQGQSCAVCILHCKLRAS